MRRNHERTSRVRPWSRRRNVALRAPLSVNSRKGNPVTKVILVAVLGLTFACAAQAQTGCSTDSLGATTCTSTSTSGTATYGYTDPLGNSNYHDTRSNTGQVSQGALGDSTYRTSNGQTGTGHTDSTGTTTYSNSNGTMTNCYTDPMGNQTCM